MSLLWKKMSSLFRSSKMTNIVSISLFGASLSCARGWSTETSPLFASLPVLHLRLFRLASPADNFTHELNGVFYRVNTFSFWDAGHCWRYLCKITIEKRFQIRKVWYDCTRPDYNDDSLCWERNFDTHWVLNMLRTDCPRLERLTVKVGNCPGRVVSLADNPRLPYHIECAGLVWKQRDRNPARITYLLSRYFEEILLYFHQLAMLDFPLSTCQLEFVSRHLLIFLYAWTGA
ncbi:hypothetical protein F5Y03DRAFT_98478 [Xylaria venustula]|nr:hypothetical protein F5Y03DRAFT_98478 [Xylaria venustula]